MKDFLKKFDIIIFCGAQSIIKIMCQKQNIINWITRWNLFIFSIIKTAGLFFWDFKLKRMIYGCPYTPCCLIHTSALLVVAENTVRVRGVYTRRRLDEAALASYDVAFVLGSGIPHHLSVALDAFQRINWNFDSDCNRRNHNWFIIVNWNYLCPRRM